MNKKIVLFISGYTFLISIFILIPFINKSEYLSKNNFPQFSKFFVEKKAIKEIDDQSSLIKKQHLQKATKSSQNGFFSKVKKFFLVILIIILISYFLAKSYLQRKYLSGKCGIYFDDKKQLSIVFSYDEGIKIWNAEAKKNFFQFDIEKHKDEFNICEKLNNQNGNKNIDNFFDLLLGFLDFIDSSLLQAVYESEVELEILSEMAENFVQSLNTLTFFKCLYKPKKTSLLQKTIDQEKEEKKEDHPLFLDEIVGIASDNDNDENDDKNRVSLEYYGIFYNLIKKIHEELQSFLQTCLKEIEEEKKTVQPVEKNIEENIEKNVEKNKYQSLLDQEEKKYQSLLDQIDKYMERINQQKNKKKVE